MSSVSGVSGSDPTAIAKQIAEQNRLSAGKPAATDATNTTNVLSRLNALYGSDSTNKAKSSLDDVAGMLGVDSETLTEQLQGPNAAKVKELMGQAALLKTFEGMDSGSSSGNIFDSKA